MSHNKHQRGLSLIEVMLVMVVMGAIILYGLRQIYTLRVSVDALQVRDNVDLIFKAMSFYYKANCNGRIGAWGTLSPNTPLVNPSPVNIQTDLRDNGYLSAPIGVNPFVDYTDPLGTMGYIAQFNNSTAERNICTSVDAVTGECDPATTVVIGTIYSWKAQVAVKVKDTAHKESYLNLLGGDCLSTASGSTITPCSPGSTGDYIVWERNPSLSSLYGNPVSWLNNPLLTRFNNQYRTYEIEYLMETVGQTPGGTQFFVCGD